MKIPFFKYQGTGNDFILIDNRENQIKDLGRQQVAALCHRRFGIGADGLILLQEKQGYDFEMVYYNSDGNPSSMCGNGGRCITRFAFDLGVIEKEAFFLAADGPHKAFVNEATISLQMKDVSSVEKTGNDFYLNTGSPHYVRYMPSAPQNWKLVEDARAIRYNERFKQEGTNVNLVQDCGEYLEVRTYERGVEDETYSCGTGVTAVALVNHAEDGPGTYVQKIHTPGGNLQVTLTKISDTVYSDIWLQGPAVFVFSGEITI